MSDIEDSRNGKDINPKDKYGSTALHIAAIRDKRADVEHLLDSGADPDPRDLSGETPLKKAITRGRTEIVKILVHGGADVNLENNGRTPLYEAVRFGQTEIVKILVHGGADVNFRSSQGRTPLYSAANKGYTEIVKILLCYGADANARNSLGSTTLHTAVISGRTEIVKMLLDNGADVDSRDSWGQTPLYSAASGGRTETVKILLRYGADISIRAKNGLSIDDAAGINQKIRAVLENPPTVNWKALKAEETKSLKQTAPRKPETEEQRALCQGKNVHVNYFFNGKSWSPGDITIYQLIYEGKLSEEAVSQGNESIDTQPKEGVSQENGLNDNQQEEELDKSQAYRWIHLPLNNVSARISTSNVTSDHDPDPVDRSKQQRLCKGSF
jgi:ankyrin repeat protein